MLAAEGSPLFWVATHRKHHAHSDQDEDPHSPLHGFLWGHMLWLIARVQKGRSKSTLRAMGARSLQRPLCNASSIISCFVVPWLEIAALYCLGQYALGGIGISMVLWGVCLRMIACYHSTWVRQLWRPHTWGYRNYETRDFSTNSWWVAMLSYGEGWHNNHHAHQRLARHGHRWGELDITYAMIWLLKVTGLATKVQNQIPPLSSQKRLV